MIKKASSIGYAAVLATSPAWLTACTTQPTAQSEDPSVLFSVDSEGMRFENFDGGLGITAVLENVDPDAVWFAERPVHESGALMTSELAGEWDEGGPFAQNPPTAALVLHEPMKVDGGMTDTMLATVNDMNYDPETQSLRVDLTAFTQNAAGQYEGKLAGHGDRHDVAWPPRAGATSLFIDTTDFEAVRPKAEPSSATGTSKPAASGSASTASAADGAVIVQVDDATGSTTTSANDGATAKPGAIVQVMATLKNDGTVDVSWRPVQNKGGASSIAYWVQMTSFRSQKPTTASGTLTTLPSGMLNLNVPVPPATDTSPSQTVLQEIVESMYRFTITAQNSKGNGPTSALTAILSMPLMPAQVTNCVTDNSCTVSTPKQGSITLCSSPSSCNGSSTQNYTYNSTIYLQVTINDTVSMGDVRHEIGISGSRL